jgi:cobalt-zinc-cadmium efflux system outer membrane protein
MSRGRTVLVAGLCALVVQAVSAQTLTEEQALARMRLEHPQIQVLDLTVRELEADTHERTLLPNPAFTYTREDSGLNVDDFLLVTQELPLRGRRGLLGEASAQAVTAAQAGADADLLAFDTRLRLAFTDLLMAQAQVAVLEDGLTALTGLVDVLRARESEGEGSLFDRLRAEREMADTDVDLESAEIDLLRSQVQLAFYFMPGSDPTTLQAAGALTDGADIAELESLLAPALERRGDYRALIHRETHWVAERRAAQRLRFPETSITAGLKRSWSPTLRDSGYALTATVAIPLFNRGQAQVARAEAARARVNAERSVLGAQIESQVRAAHAAASRYADLTDRYRAESVEPASELVAIATAAYQEGEYGVLELLDAHRVKLGAERRLLALSAAARRAAIDLNHAVGGEATP